MKKLLITFCLILIYTSTYSQNTDNEEVKIRYKNEIGLDLGAFLTKENNGSIIALDDNNQPIYFLNSYENYQPIYFLNYKILGKKVNGRFALGGKLFTFPRTEDPEGNTNSIFLKIGFEAFKEISQKWEFYGGADLNSEFYSSSIPNPVQHNSKIKGKVNVIGWGPLLGFRFKVHQRVNFQFESALRINHASEFMKITNLQFDDDTDNDKIKNTFTSMPFRLLINCRF
ncbi:hypothetical protein [Xanthovirga aplysinae]|uniref:hypothetical protein n=1 Tax=Xanthovirga aplysinae TaxID=2529853 RepID=UPI0012BD61F7|nr:hypothetical protein [Xanthovirga aplysinae]MTI31917.1 hypothetical protein [Xanthovirga aplysinae]